MSFLPRQHGTVQAVEALLRANDEFQAAYPGAWLVEVELSRGVPENRPECYYRRYR